MTEFKGTFQAFYEFLFWGLGKKACITVSLLNFQAWFPATNHLVYDFNEINVICKNNNTKWQKENNFFNKLMYKKIHLSNPRKFWFAMKKNTALELDWYIYVGTHILKEMIFPLFLLPSFNNIWFQWQIRLFDFYLDSNELCRSCVINVVTSFIISNWSYQTNARNL